MSSQATGPVVLDPTAESEPVGRARLPRPPTLKGLSLGLLDISKARGDIFLDRLEARFRQEGAQVRRYKKPTFTKPAPVDVRRQIAEECEAVVEALAD
ncbi:MAG: hypothetical protein CBC48_09105 [bacterium TMED88]|nr:hypothetical protein [Deltaproteobacteria bacterium]OUV31827.1 MAG: hypothetical protein CBC48_09105 [bacterium TMED88]